MLSTQDQSAIFIDLGCMEYQTVWKYQEKLLHENIHIKSEWLKRQDGREGPHTINYLIMVEHPPVYTLGKSGKEGNILIDDDTMRDRGIQYFRTNRGGDVTFHGPGQLVLYPILDLENFGTDIGQYLRNLEETVILVLKDYGIPGERSKGETGVWIEPLIKQNARKICAIGVRCSRWITMHGLALNVNTDLSYFTSIIPCGIPDKQVTSMANELGQQLSVGEVKASMKKNFEFVFKCKLKTDVIPELQISSL
ncbi:MAG TPA: lipoyl(octanoyl) transferase LipB [Puia sp.]|nr:lipoyl(octanoyl) transferase LipB [Puia sp.]